MAGSDWPADHRRRQNRPRNSGEGCLVAKTSLPITTYLDADGGPLANGSLLLRLSQDGSANDTQLCAMPITIPLDSGGTITGSPMFWPNAEITPLGTTYIISAYSAKGQLVSGPNSMTL